MDTILKPRYLCSTATEESSSEEDNDNDVVPFDKKDSTCSSKITVIPNCPSIIHVQTLEEKDDEDDNEDEHEEECSSGSKIVCPTARFLQVNPKKVSSFDLLVRPPKRPRFINHPSRELISHAAAFKQKTKPSQGRSPINPNGEKVSRKKSPVLESIYFENEKLRYRQTMSGNWSSSSSSASPRNQTNPNAKSHGPPKPMKSQQYPEQVTSIYVNPESLPQKLSEEDTLRDIELSDAYHRNVYAGEGARAVHMEEYTQFVQAENSPEESKDASSIFRTCYEDQSSTFDGHHVILDEKTGEFRVIHHPDLRERQSESATVLDGDSFLENLADDNGNIGEFKEEVNEDDEEDDLELNAERPISALQPKDSYTHLNGNRSSPLTIFLTGLGSGLDLGSGIDLGSGLDLGQGQDLADMRFEMGSPFSNFGTGGESGEEEEEEADGELDGSRIEDVTDLVGDDEQVDSVIHLVRSGEDGEGSNEMKTIFWANSSPGASNDTNKMDRVTSEACQLIDGFKDKRQEKGTTSELNTVSQNSWDLQEEIDAQEFLLQPKPKLNLSSSFHSAFERGNVEPTSTVAMFVEKNRTKSDYFVGKIKGASKTLLKPGFFTVDNNSSITIKSNLEFNEDSKIDITGNDDTKDSQGLRPEEESRPRHHHHQQQKLHKSSSALAIAVVNAKRKVSTGNRVSNAIPDKTQKKKGMSPPPRNQTPTVITTSTRRGEVQQLRFPRPLTRSSSSSSHQQILMTIKAKSPQQKNAKNIENQKHQKSILKKDKKQNIFMRIFGRLFGISSSEKSKQASSSTNRKQIDDLIPSVPSSILKRSDRGIVHHTDSKELYRERRRNFFNEQKEFRDESLATYLEGMLSHENSSGAQDFVTIPPRIPLNYFLERSVMFPREAAEDAFNNNSSRNPDNNNNETTSSTVPVPVRLAKSESALAGTTTGGFGGGVQGGSGRQSSLARANLVLQFPPFVQVLAAGMTRRRRSSLENKSDFKRVKDELKKPLRGILKNQQT